METRNRRRWLVLVSALLFLLAVILTGLWMGGIGYRLEMQYPPGASPVVRISRRDSADLALLVISGSGRVSVTNGVYSLQFYGFGHDLYPKTFRTPEGNEWYVEYWLLIVLSLAVSLACYHRSPRIKRRSVGHCQMCGYDLRTHKPGEKCPECGTVIPQPGGG